MDIVSVKLWRYNSEILIQVCSQLRANASFPKKLKIDKVPPIMSSKM
jgi:hypothetical protein